MAPARGGQWWIALAFLGAIWTLVSSLELGPHYLVPSPQEVGSELLRALRSGRLGWAIVISLRRLVLGFGLSVVIGTLIGLASARVAWLRPLLRPLILGLQALPSICWLPLALLWFGLSETAILFVVAMGSVFAMAIATEGAVLSVPPLYVRAARTMGARGFSLYARVILPGALPGIVTGLRLGWTFAWRSLMAAELLYVAGGLGQLLTMGRELGDMALVVAVMLVIIALGLLFDRFLLGQIERRVRTRWGQET